MILRRLSLSRKTKKPKSKAPKPEGPKFEAPKFKATGALAETIRPRTVSESVAPRDSTSVCAGGENGSDDISPNGSPSRSSTDLFQSPSPEEQAGAWTIFVSRVGLVASFFLGLFYSRTPLFAVYLNPVLTRYFYFVALFIAWHVLIRTVYRFYGRAEFSRNLTPRRRRAEFAFLALVVIVAGTLLQLFRLKTSEGEFVVALFALGAFALSFVMVTRGKFLRSALLDGWTVASVGYISFYSLLLEMRLVPIVPSISLGCIYAAMRLEMANASLSNKERSFSERAQIILICTAPTLLAILRSLESLPVEYLAPLVILAPIALRARETKLPQRIAWMMRSDVLFAVYLVILGTIRFLTEA